MLRVLLRPSFVLAFGRGPSLVFLRHESDIAADAQIRTRQKYISRNRSFNQQQQPQGGSSVKFKEKRGGDAEGFELTDPDSFGTLSLGQDGRARVVDEVSAGVSEEVRAIKQKYESIYTEEEADDQTFKPDVRWSMRKLKKRVVELLKERKLTQALDTFVEVIQDGGFQFDEFEIAYLYQILISECGKAGHVQQAYKLFTDMKKRGYRVKPAIFTALFNACANSPWEGEANLKRIRNIRDSMEERGFVPNIMHYNAMIKAYGRCGAIESAFSVVDDMTTQTSGDKIYLNCATFNFLLQACITDRDNGFRHAILTWTKMSDMRIQPDLFSYNLLLRVIRECGIQLPDSESSKTKNREFAPKSDLDRKGPQQQLPDNDYSKRYKIPTRPLHLAPSASTSIAQNMSMFDLICLQKEDRVEDLDNGETKSALPVMKSNEEIMFSLTVPENRLAVLGGLRAFTSQLDRDRLRPDLKTLTELIQIVTPKEIEDVLMLMERNKIKPDVDFFNMVMKRHITFKELDMAREVVKNLSTYHLTPNVMTWGILATACATWGDASVLFREMDDIGIAPNEIILGALVLNACKAYDPRYILRMMEEQIRREIQPSSYFVERVTEFKSRVQRAVVDSESGREVRPRRLAEIIETEFFREYWQKFKLRYDRWMKEIEVTSEPQNAWKDDYYDRIERLKKRKYEIK